MNFDINTAIAYPLNGYNSPHQRFTYQRKEYPQLVNLEEKLAEIYKAQKVLIVNSGMEAFTTLLDYYLDDGNTIMINRNLYAEAQLWLKAIKRYDIIMADFHDLDALKKLVQMTNPKLLHLDCPSMKQEWYNIKEIANIAHEYGAKLSVDNSIVSFYYYNPILDGADFVPESYSKYVCGHGDTMAGALIFKDTPAPKNGVATVDFFEWRGRCVNPLQVYNIERGIETLGVRLQKSTDTAKYIHKMLLDKKIHHLYAGTAANIVIPCENPLKTMEKFVNTKMFTPLSAYGATFSIITPSRRADSYQDDMNYIRLSFGMEDKMALASAVKAALELN